MDLYPQDLRDRQHATIIRRRAHGLYGGATPSTYAGLAADPPAPRPVGRLGRIWARGMNLTEREIETSLPAASMSVGAAQWAGPLFAAIPMVISAVAAGIAPTPGGIEVFGGATTLWGAITGLSMAVFPGYALRGLYRKPLSASEIDAPLFEARDDVDRAYLNLLREAITQDVPEEAEIGLRDALRSLGRAVDSLPLNVWSPQNTDELRRQGTELLARARSESDEIIAASLERQADALSRRATMGERSALVTQRAQALRQEVLAQIDALRAGLSDFSTEGAGASNVALLATLSEDARRVADAAESVAQARTELDTYLTAPESAVVQAGRG